MRRPTRAGERKGLVLGPTKLLAELGQECGELPLYLVSEPRPVVSRDS